MENPQAPKINITRGDVVVIFRKDGQSERLMRSWLSTAILTVDVWDLSELDAKHADLIEPTIKKASIIITDDKKLQFFAEENDVTVCPIASDDFLIAQHKMANWLTQNCPPRTMASSNRVKAVELVRPVKKKKLLLVVTYFKDEEEAVKQNLGIITAMMGKNNMSPYANIMLAVRADTLIDPDWVRTLSRYFEKVHQFTCARATEIGWPQGPNAMWHEIVSEVWRLTRDKIEDSDAFLLMEADLCPLVINWQELLQNEWYEGSQLVLGCEMKECARHHKHINGNALYDTRLCNKIQGLHGCSYQDAYDVFHYQKWGNRAKASRLIYNDWGRKTITEAQLFQGQSFEAFPKEKIVPIMYHGVKDNSARDIVTKKFNLTYPLVFAKE